MAQVNMPEKKKGMLDTLGSLTSIGANVASIAGSGGKDKPKADEPAPPPKAALQPMPPNPDNRAIQRRITRSY